MRTVINVGIALLCFVLGTINLASNPFTPSANATPVEGCQGSPPGPNCGCCQDCGCWQCE